MLENISRRSFIAAATVAVAGAAATAGSYMAAGVSPAVAAEAQSAWEAGQKPLAGEVGEWIDLPWNGIGSAAGDWVATPAEIAALGGSTMPVDELNRRRKMYIEAQGDYICADGRVIPAIYNQVRALFNTFSWGVGSIPQDYSFTHFVEEVSEDQAQALLQVPYDGYFRAIDLYAAGGRALEECVELLDDLASKGYLRRSKRTDGVVYNLSGWFEGIGGYLMNDVSMGDPAYEWPVGGDGMAVDWGNAGTPVFHSLPCDKSVTASGEILAYDDIEAIFKSATTFAVTPCSCRYTMLINDALEKGEEYPSFADFANDALADLTLPDSDVRVETCLCTGDEAAFWIAQGTAREITQEQALDILRKNREDGFIIECTRESHGEYTCACRKGYCNVVAFWEALHEELGTLENSMAWNQLSDYRLEVDYDACVQCGTCANRCPMQAITMEAEHNGEAAYPLVSDMCFKCGQCAYVCPMEARKLVERPTEECLPIMPNNLVEDYRLKAAYRFEHGMMY